MAQATHISLERKLASSEGVNDMLAATVHKMREDKEFWCFFMLFIFIIHYTSHTSNLTKKTWYNQDSIIA